MTMTKAAARFLSRTLAAGLLSAQLGAPSVYAMHGANNEERVRALQGTVAEQATEIDGLRRDIQDRDTRIADLELGDVRRCLLYRLQKIYDNMVAVRKALGILYFGQVDAKYPPSSYCSSNSTHVRGPILESVFESARDALISPHNTTFLSRKLSEIQSEMNKRDITQFIADFSNLIVKTGFYEDSLTWNKYEKSLSSPSRDYTSNYIAIPFLLKEIRALSSNLPRLGDDEEGE